MKAETLITSIIQILRKNISKSALFFLMVFIAETSVSQTWSPMPGGGMNDWVYATTVYNGDLIVAGKFTAAGGVSANHIARWDGTSWWPLGSGLNGKVNALTVYDGYLVAAGEFTLAGGIEVNFISQWNGIEWDDQLGGVGNTVTSLAVIGTDLYVGGRFTDADGVPANYIAKRNNTGWHSLAGGMSGGEGQVMALTVHNGELYAGGFFTTAGGQPANHIAKWNGTSWDSLGSGIGHIVYALSEYNGSLIAGGLFSSAGGITAHNIASWNGTSWSALGGGMGGIFYQYVFALAVYNGHLIAGGYFTTSDGMPTNGMAKWDGTSWSGMGGGLWYPANVYGAHTFCLYGPDLIVGGLFTSAGAVGASHIASWNEPVTPVTLNIQNDTIPNGTYVCYDATQTITVAGGGTSFVVQDGGNATMIAGQNIIYLPGTKVDSGGYLLGYITTNGQFCGYQAAPVMMSAESRNKENISGSGNSLLKVYPNPTSGNINIELNGGQETSEANIEIISMRGERILSYALKNEKKHQLSISDQPAGVYFIRLISEVSIETAMIIKQD